MKKVPKLNTGKITLADINVEVKRLRNELYNQSKLASFEPYRITDSTEIEKPVPVITINDEIISTAGNLTTISGASKSGKSAFTSILMAGAISTDGLIDGLEFVNVQPNTNKKAVIHIDTEQARHKHQNNILSVFKRAKLNKCPNYFLSYNIRQLEITQYAQVTTGICEAAQEQFKGIHLIVIDGIADFISDVNDAEQSTTIVKYFEELAIKYSTPIIVIVHTNPGTDKERGHLGSQCQRKCESLLCIKTEGNISFIEPKLLRMAGKGSIPSIQFTFDKDKGYHVGCGIRSVSADDKNATRLNSIKVICQEIFKEQTSITYQQVLNAIMQQTNKSMPTAKNLFTDMATHKMILQDEDKKWQINNSQTMQHNNKNP